MLPQTNAHIYASVSVKYAEYERRINVEISKVIYNLIVYRILCVESVGR
jgi:hypothetical protein